MTTENDVDRYEAIGKLMRENNGNEGISNALADCERAMKRAVRADTLPAEYERIDLKQNRGPTLEFMGKEIASTEFETRGRDPMQITLEVYETPAGALVAVSSSVPADRPDGFEDVRAHVVKPTDDVGAMQREVMEFFGWADRARSMLRKAGWSFKMEVE